MPERVTYVNKEEEFNKDVVEKIFEEYQIFIQELEDKVAILETEQKSLEDRLSALE